MIIFTLSIFFPSKEIIQNLDLTPIQFKQILWILILYTLCGLIIDDIYIYKLIQNIRHCFKINDKTSELFLFHSERKCVFKPWLCYCTFWESYSMANPFKFIVLILYIRFPPMSFILVKTDLRGGSFYRIVLFRLTEANNILCYSLPLIQFLK